MNFHIWFTLLLFQLNEFPHLTFTISLSNSKSKSPRVISLQMGVETSLKQLKFQRSSTSQICKHFRSKPFKEKKSQRKWSIDKKINQEPCSSGIFLHSTNRFWWVHSIQRICPLRSLVVGGKKTMKKNLFWNKHKNVRPNRSFSQNTKRIKFYLCPKKKYRSTSLSYRNIFVLYIFIFVSSSKLLCLFPSCFPIKWKTGRDINARPKGRR